MKKTIALLFALYLLFIGVIFADAETIELKDKDYGETAFTAYELQVNTVYKKTYSKEYHELACWYCFTAPVSGEYSIDILNSGNRSYSQGIYLLSMYGVLGRSKEHRSLSAGESETITAKLESNEQYFLLIDCIGGVPLTFIINTPNTNSLASENKSFKLPQYQLLQTKSLSRSMDSATEIQTDKLYAIHDTDTGYHAEKWFCFTVPDDGDYFLTLRNFSNGGAVGNGLSTGNYKMKLMSSTKTLANYDSYNSISIGNYIQFEIKNLEANKYFIYIDETGNYYSERTIDYTLALCSSKHIDLNETGKGKKASCTEDGFSSTICTVCGQEGPQIILPATGHTPSEETVVQMPTCVSDGYSVVKCTVCSEELSRTTIPATENHTPDNGSIVLSATCTDPGKMIYTCTVCGKQLNEEVIPALGHQPSAEIALKAATCQHQGVSGVRCLVCGEILSTSPIPLGDHTPGEWTVIKEATCTEEGIQSRSCKVCGIELEQETIIAKGHTFADWTILQEASCTVDGFKAHVCELCGETFDVTAIPATGHHFGKWQVKKLPSADEPGEQSRVCDVCGTEETKELTLAQP